MSKLNNLTERLIKADMTKLEFYKALSFIDEVDIIEDESIPSLNCLGLCVYEYGDLISLRSKKTKWKDDVFCVVDIETNGCMLKDSKIIEIGAVIFQNGKIIDIFDSLVFAEEVPEIIVNLTGITANMLKDAPSEATVLEKFRLFLKDAIFVAHNVNFDYSFISYAMQKYGFPPLLNRKLCTVELARKTIESPKYGLQALRELLEITEGEAHRGFWDAKSAAIVLDECCKKLPENVLTTEDLIAFSKQNKKKVKIKKEQVKQGLLFSTEGEV